MQQLEKGLIRHPSCPYCRGEVRPEEPKVACAACMSFLHPECWEEHGACGACSSVKVLREEAPGVVGAGPPRPRRSLRASRDRLQPGDTRTCVRCQETFEVTLNGLNNPRCVSCHHRHNLPFVLVALLPPLAYLGFLILGAILR